MKFEQNGIATPPVEYNKSAEAEDERRVFFTSDRSPNWICVFKILEIFCEPH
jgi:hypothetical protein